MTGSKLACNLNLSQLKSAAKMKQLKIDPQLNNLLEILTMQSNL